MICMIQKVILLLLIGTSDEIPDVTNFKLS